MIYKKNDIILLILIIINRQGNIMTKYLYFIITLIFITPLCNAMKRTSDISASENIITLSTIKNPHSAIVLSYKTVAILGDDGCSIYDISTKKEIVKLNNDNDSTGFRRSITTDPNKKTLALWRNKKLEIYDIATKNKIWEITDNSRGAPIFSPMDDTIVVYKHPYMIETINYKNNSYKSYPLPTEKVPFKMEFHPTKQEFMFDTYDSIETLELVEGNLIAKTFPIKDLSSCKYSPDGSLIAINHTSDKCSILNLKDGSCESLIGRGNKNLNGMAFHPNNCTLATLSFLFPYIHYWNTKTRKLITSSPLIVDSDEADCFFQPCPFDKCMDFFDNGTKLIVIFKGKILVLTVPTIVREYIG
jgi:hypothetical protein